MYKAYGADLSRIIYVSLALSIAEEGSLEVKASMERLRKKQKVLT